MPSNHQIRPLTIPTPLTLQTPCKINFHLFIQGKRSDGYHELALDFIPLNLFDEIQLEPHLEGIQLTSPDLCPTEDNLVVKAIRLLEKESSQNIALKIKLTKNIPHGAGLGGGSANAAGILSSLNQILQLKIEPQRLVALATSLGADVPFFLEPVPSIAAGIGEKLTPCPFLAEVYLILFYPGISISTKEAYSLAHHSRRTLTPSCFSKEEIFSLSPDSNDFWGPLSEKYPELRSAQARLQAGKPEAIGFSGSGSCLYALFQDQKKRDEAFEKLHPSSLERAFKVEPLTSYHYLKSKL